jgi:hypothetical protein
VKVDIDIGQGIEEGVESHPGQVQEDGTLTWAKQSPLERIKGRSVRVGETLRRAGVEEG